MSIDTFRFCNDEYQGLGETLGLAQRQDDGLSLQWHTRDALFGLLKSRLNCAHLPATKMASIDYRSGWFGLWPRVHICLSDLSDVERLPAATGGEITLRVRRGDRHTAAEIVKRLQLSVSEHRYRALQQDIDQLAQGNPRQAIAPLPPPPPTANPRASSQLVE